MNTTYPTTPAPFHVTSVHPAPLAGAFRDSGFETPSFVMDLERFHANGRLLHDLQERTGVRILLAQKAFSCHPLYPTLRPYLAGTAASGIHEARLGREQFGGEVHVFSPAYKPRDIEELLLTSDHITFNSLGQWESHRDTIAAAARPISPGLRINPASSGGSPVALYDPCAPGSRFGVLAGDLAGADLTGIEGFHCHVLCQQLVDALERAVAAIETKFGPWLSQLQWLNLGGGHLLTDPAYDLDRLVTLLNGLTSRYPNLTLYLEPGETVAAHAGVLIGSVIDIVENGMQIAILDVSATCHMPDVLEMPYRPDVTGAGAAGERPFTYRLGGPTCLSGDVIGDYSFDQPLQIGDQVVFEDQAHYTMVKTSTFNGIGLPSITIYQNQEVHLLKDFGYEDFMNRLG